MNGMTMVQAAALTGSLYLFSLGLKSVIWFVWHFVIDLFVSWKSLARLVMKAMAATVAVTFFGLFFWWLAKTADESGERLWFYIVNTLLWIVLVVYVCREFNTFCGITEHDWSIRNYRFVVFGIFDKPSESTAAGSYGGGQSGSDRNGKSAWKKWCESCDRRYDDYMRSEYIHHGSW